MLKYQKVAELVEQQYSQSEQEFAQWMWKYHVPVVAKNTEELAARYGADVDIAVAGAWLHDFGDAFVHRHAEDHDVISESKALKVLELAGYSPEEQTRVLQEVIAPHSCRDGNVPETIEGKVMATADALAHLTTDFYVQFTWKHLPENKNYQEFIVWVTEKLRRDFNDKIFFDEVKENVWDRYEALVEVFSK